jgi:hypothetical protein
MAGHNRPRRGVGTKLALSLIILALIGIVESTSTLSAFSAITQNPGNTFSTGSVDLEDDDAGSAMLTLSAAKPGDTDEGCIRVRYLGTLPATVKLYGTTTDTNTPKLGDYLTLTVEQGTISSPRTPTTDCATFAPSATIYNGTLTGFPDDWTAGVGLGSWTQNQTQGYRFTITVQDNSNAQGKSASQIFTWEARS